MRTNKADRVGPNRLYYFLIFHLYHTTINIACQYVIFPQPSNCAVAPDSPSAKRLPYAPVAVLCDPKRRESIAWAGLTVTVWTGRIPRADPRPQRVEDVRLYRHARPRCRGPDACALCLAWADCKRVLPFLIGCIASPFCICGHIITSMQRVYHIGAFM